MDQINRWIIAAVFLIILIATGSTSYSELLYSLRGRQAQGVVTDSYTVKVRRSFNHIAEYEFTEADGTRRTGRTIVSSDWSVLVGGKVTVLYVPGGNSRLVGYPDRFGVILFLVMLGVVFVGAIVWLIRALANRPPPRRRRKKRWHD